jgi:MSHA biogenesis protein MshI
MIQQVNLYTAELRPKTEWLQAGMVLGLVALAALMLAVAFGITQYQTLQLEARNVTLDRQNQLLEQSVAQLAETVQTRQVDAGVRDELVRITDAVGRRQHLLSRIEELIPETGAGFSLQMTALARQIPDNVWLIGLNLNARKDEVTINGRASSSALVPDYLENLSNEPVFAGRTFGAFRLLRPENETWIEFHVATKTAQEGH